jgi:hypothetical protein
MLTQSIRRKPGLVLAVCAAFLSLSGLAQAQQSGMFPLHAIKRERTPCANEEPIYKLYRNQYYGYFPTQWRRFPDGWSLRSPEGPNTIEELKKNPIEGPKPFAPGEEDMQGPETPAPKPAIPNPPRDERSPFEMDRPEPGAGAVPGVAPPARTTPAPRSSTAPPASDASPFDIPETKPAAPGDRPQASRPNRPSTPSLDDAPAPDLAPPGNAPPVPPRTSWNRRRESRQTDPGPLLSISDAMLPAIEEASSPADPAGASSADTVVSSSGAGEPALAPTTALPQAPRRGPISSLFAGLGLDWLRR